MAIRSFILSLLLIPHGSLGIIDGDLAGEPVWPWLLSLVNTDNSSPTIAHTCSATLIAPDWALTAAHCLTAGDNWEVLAHATNLDDPLGRRYRVSDTILHHAFIAPGSPGIDYSNDIALLHLDSPIEGVIPVDLPGPLFDDLPVRPATPAIIRGWGARSFDPNTQQAGDYPLELHQLLQTVVAESDCKDKMGPFGLSASMFCSRDPDGSGDSCVGDSGGPLIVPANSPSGFLQIGIISWGLGCAIPDTYGVNTRLGIFARWISEQACEPSDIPSTPSIESLDYLSDGRVDFRYLGDADDQTRFRLYFAPADALTPIRYLDMGNATDYLGPVPPGVTLKVAVQSYRGLCNSKFSLLTDIAG